MAGLKNTKPHSACFNQRRSWSCFPCLPLGAPCGVRDLSERRGGMRTAGRERGRPPACVLPPAETAAGTGQKRSFSVDYYPGLDF